jgi:hypothetical protein
LTTASERYDERAAKISRFAHGSTTGLTLEIIVGVEVWSRAEWRSDSDGNPIGGAVLECHAGASGFDKDTGEFIERPPWYTVYDRYALPGHRIRTLEEVGVDRSASRPASNLGLIVRDLAGELAVYKKARGTRKRGSNMLSGHELDLTRWIGALGKVIAGGVLAPVTVQRPMRKHEETDEF